MAWEIPRCTASRRRTTVGAVLDRLLAQVCYRKWIAVDRVARGDWPMDALPPAPPKFIIAGLGCFVSGDKA